ADAEGDAARFLALLAEYKKAPEVTRERLYIEAVEDVYSRTNKVILDTDGSGNLLYLPIDKLIEAGGERRTLNRADSGRTSMTQSPSESSSPENAEAGLRDRRTRQ